MKLSAKVISARARLLEESGGEGGGDVEKSFSRFLLGLLVSSCFRLKLMDAPHLLDVL